jgi:hypothetical protein
MATEPGLLGKIIVVWQCDIMKTLYITLLDYLPVNVCTLVRKFSYEHIHTSDINSMNEYKMPVIIFSVNCYTHICTYF